MSPAATGPRSPGEVRDWYLQKYQRSRAAWLVGEGVWPLSRDLATPVEEAALRDPRAIRQWVESWQREAIQFPAGVTLEWVERRWPTRGRERLPARVSIDSPDTLATWLQLEQWPLHCARHRALTDIGVEPRAAARQADAIAALADPDFALLEQVLAWVRSAPASSDLYLRQLPIPGIHSKWIEQRSGLVASLLAASRTGATIYEQLGLRQPPARIRIRLLCPVLRAACAGLSDIDAPIADLAALPIMPATVLIVENLATGLALPDSPGVVVIMKLGYAVEPLAQLLWLVTARVLYWGDLDTHGFACLARARHYVPGIRSVLMDEGTLLAQRELWVPEPNPSTAERLRQLDHDERAVYRKMRASHWGMIPRLEQERLPWDLALATLRSRLEPAQLRVAKDHAPGTRLLTKSRFTLALTCPRKLEYADDTRYANARAADEFLRALADGGHQVGALAKCLFVDGVEVNERDHAAAVERTKQLLAASRDVTLFEAAFAFGQLFVRVDVLIKRGDTLEVHEVKAKSYDSRVGPSAFLGARGELASDFLPYLYDVAFQRFVVRHAMPGASVSAHLILPDKASASPESAVAQRLPLVRAGRQVSVVPHPSLAGGLAAQALLARVPVNPLCDRAEVMALETGDWAYDFVEGIDAFADYLQTRRFPAPRLGNHCRRCEFRVTAAGQADAAVLDGRQTCWKEAVDVDLARPTVLDLYGRTDIRQHVENGRVLLEDLEPEDFDLERDAARISASERQWLQCEEARGAIATPVVRATELKFELARLQFPLHFVDFETASPALPYFLGQRPYGVVLFQFSHHRLERDGAIEHRSQCLVDAGEDDPSFEVLRALRTTIGDVGSVIHWWTHEKTVLLAVRERLIASSESDRDTLVAFVDDLVATRLVDLGQHLVRPYVFVPGTRGSSSLKNWLRPLLSFAPNLRERFAQRIYGSEQLPSHNYSDLAWIQRDVDGQVRDPYDILRELGADVFDVERANEMELDHAVIADGGAAMIAYALLRDPALEPTERTRTRAQLLRYCELDTFAMVLAYLGLLELLG